MQYELLDEKFRNELLSGENVLWTGQPNRNVVFHPKDALLIPFSLLWGGFAIFWEAGVLGMWGSTTKTPENVTNWFFALWGVPFILIGQYLIWGRFVYDWWCKKRVFYAATNRRILVLSIARGRRLISIYLESLPFINKTVRADGIGTLSFGESDKRSYWGPWASFSSQGAPVFADIEDAERVYSLIANARSQREKQA
jgi:hypothetical protein